MSLRSSRNACYLSHWKNTVRDVDASRPISGPGEDVLLLLFLAQVKEEHPAWQPAQAGAEAKRRLRLMKLYPPR